MDTNTALTIAGVVVTVLFGVLAVGIAVRYSGRVRITYVHDQAIALTDDITQNFPDLGVSFHGQPVSDNLVLLKGYFVNTGKKDISPEMVEQKVTLLLPTDFEWVECRVVKCSPGMKASATIAERTAILLETGLWKVNEYLKVEGLATVPVVKADPDHLPKESPGMRLRKVLTFPHRIEGSRNIRTTRVPRPFRQVRTKRFCGLNLSLPILPRGHLHASSIYISMGLALFGLSHFVPPEKAVGYRLSLDGQEQVVSLRAGNGKILLSGNDGFGKELTPAEFDRIPDKHVEVMAKDGGRSLVMWGTICIVLGIGLALLDKMVAVKENRLLSIIAGRDEP